MKHDLGKIALEIRELREQVNIQLGLFFPDDSIDAFTKKMYEVSQDLDYKDLYSCIQKLLSRPFTQREIEVLAHHLTIGETYFFRDKNAFEIIENNILGPLIKQRDKNSNRFLRIWSAGCSTGEEPYSIAMLLEKMIPAIDDWNITIFATDINTQFLSKAVKARFTEWSFRETPSYMRDRFFKEIKSGEYEVNYKIQKLVTFSYLNLVSHHYSPLLNYTNAMDLVLCRNVLIYFDTGTRKKVIENLHRSLVDGGYLMVSPVEVANQLFPQFYPVNINTLTVYKKNSGFIPSPRTSKEPKKSATAEEILYKSDITQSKTYEQKIPASNVKDIKQDKIKEKEAEINRGNYYRAEHLYRHGKYNLALKEALQCEQVSNTYELVTKIYADTGRLNEALIWCQKLILADKFNPRSYYLQATIYQEKGMIDNAVAALRRVLYIDHTFILAHFSLANIYRQQGMSNEAHKHYMHTYALLQKLPAESIVPESDGIPVNKLIEMILSLESNNSLRE